MKKIFLLSFVLFGCKDSKTKIIERQKQVLKEKDLVERKLDAAQDSTMPTPAELKEWDSLYHVDDALQKEYDSLQKELKKYK